VDYYFHAAIGIAFVTHVILVGYFKFNPKSFWKVVHDITGINEGDNSVFFVVPLGCGLFWAPVFVFGSLAILLLGVFRLTQYGFDRLMWVKLLRWSKVKKSASCIYRAVYEELKDA